MSNRLWSSINAVGVLRAVLNVLRDRAWTGAGVMIALIALILQAEVLMGRLTSIENVPSVEGPEPVEEHAAAAGGRAPAAVGPNLEKQAPTLNEQSFRVQKRVSCPGGGDWLGRERNRRDAHMKFIAPNGSWITEAHTKSIGQKYGDYEKINYRQMDENEGFKFVQSAQLWCDPPNYPGAPGGWIEVELYGTHTVPPTELK